MNDGRSMVLQYIDNDGFPYLAPESYVDFLSGFNHVPANYGHAGPVLSDQVVLI